MPTGQRKLQVPIRLPRDLDVDLTLVATTDGVPASAILESIVLDIALGKVTPSPRTRSSDEPMTTRTVLCDAQLYASAAEVVREATGHADRLEDTIVEALERAVGRRKED